jgi:hypothetical protein
MEIEVIKGTLTASAAFITVSGIIFAINLNKRYLGNLAASSLLFSILSGAATIWLSLAWFNSQEDLAMTIAKTCLIIQFAAWFIPSVIMLFKIKL